MKHTNKTLLGKGLKYLAFALPLSGLGPVILYSAFNNQNHSWYLPVLMAGLVACAGAIYFMFRGINTLMRSIFD